MPPKRPTPKPSQRAASRPIQPLNEQDRITDSGVGLWEQCETGGLVCVRRLKATCCWEQIVNDPLPHAEEQLSVLRRGCVLCAGGLVGFERRPAAVVLFPCITTCTRRTRQAAFAPLAHLRDVFALGGLSHEKEGNHRKEGKERDRERLHA